MADLMYVIILIWWFDSFDRHMPDFTSSEFLCKHQVNILTKGQITLSDVLYNDGAMFYFMEVRVYLML